MPRTWASPRPSCPMAQLIICSATRKLMLAYASSCSVTTGCQGHNCSGCLTDWFGIRGLGLNSKMSGPLRPRAATPFCPPPMFKCPGPAVGPWTLLTVWTGPAQTSTNTDMTVSQWGDKNFEGHFELCSFSPVYFLYERDALTTAKTQTFSDISQRDQLDLRKINSC